MRNRPCSRRSCFYSLKKRGKFCQNFLHERCWQGVHLARISRAKVKHTRLITANHTGCFDACDGDSKPDTASEVAAASDRADHGQLGCLVEFGRRHDQDRATSTLLAPFGWIQGDQINVTAPPISSPPTAGASIHSRSCADNGCE